MEEDYMNNIYYSKWPTIVEEVWPVQYIGVL